MSNKLYAERDIECLDEDGNFYFKHVMAMTAESLHGKSAIAAELGYRDLKIVELQARLEHAISQRDNALAQNAELVALVERLNNFSNERIARAATLRSLIEKVLACEELVFNSDVVLVVSSELADDIRCALDATPKQNLRDRDAEVARAGFVAGAVCARHPLRPNAVEIKEEADQYAEKVRRGEV